MVILSALSKALLIQVLFANVKGIELDSGEDSKLPLETCLTPNGLFYVGLRSFSFSVPDNPLGPCELFWHCRAKPPGQLGIPVEALNFNCSNADPKKPYYDARICQCVATSDHCDLNDAVNNKYKCVQLHSLDNNPESCQGFGTNSPFYTELFPDNHDLRKFRSCHATMNGPPIPESLQCPNNLIFDARNCYCNYNSSSLIYEEIRSFNSHPMNRFNCAEPLIERPTK